MFIDSHKPDHFFLTQERFGEDVMHLIVTYLNRIVSKVYPDEYKHANYLYGAFTEETKTK